MKLQKFLSSNPKMRLTHFGNETIIIEGKYNVNSQMEGFNTIHDTYTLKISFSKEYPRVIPKVIEPERRIPRNSEHHTYEDGAFCLGSEINLKAILSKTPNITDFADKILDPFLYSVSYKLKYNHYPNGDLDHGEAGLIDDYERLFRVNGKSSVLGVLAALGKRKRVANKLLCPCGCRKRLGKCEFRFTLEKWRSLDRRRWYREHRSTSFTSIEIQKGRKKSERLVTNSVQKSGFERECVHLKLKESAPSNQSLFEYYRLKPERCGAGAY